MKFNRNVEARLLTSPTVDTIINHNTTRRIEAPPAQQPKWNTHGSRCIATFSTWDDGVEILEQCKGRGGTGNYPNGWLCDQCNHKLIRKGTEVAKP